MTETTAAKKDEAIIIECANAMLEILKPLKPHQRGLMLSLDAIELTKCLAISEAFIPKGPSNG